MNTEALGWVFIYLGMIVGIATWFVIMISIFKDFKDKK